LGSCFNQVAALTASRYSEAVTAWTLLTRMFRHVATGFVRRKESTPRLSGGSYDFWSGHLDWLGPTPAELDVEIEALCEEFAEGDASTRAALTASLNADDSYALQLFAERSAIFGLRTGNAELVRRGLVGVAAVDPDVIDFRDAGTPLPRLFYCLTQCGDDARSAFERTEQLATGRMASVLQANRQRLAGYSSMDDLSKHELVREVMTKLGPGFVRPSIAPYEPSCDLTEASLRVAEVLREDLRYQFDVVTTATDLPTYWLWGRDNDEANRMRRSIKGVCAVESRLRPEHDENPSRSPLVAQWLNVYIVETKHSSVSQSLALAAGRLQHNRAAMFAVTAGRLAAVVLALVSSETTRLAESTVQLGRFREPLSKLLTSTACDELEP
jgi:hypothetical protein